jgi:glycosyltransferase involved in cell wall biosynthesis
MRTTNVLYVYSGKSRLNAGGLDLVVRQQMQALVDEGFNVTFLSRGSFIHPLVKNITIKITPANVLSILSARYYYNAQHRFFAMVASWLLGQDEFDLTIGWLQQSRSLFRKANNLGIPCALNCTVDYYKSRKDAFLPKYYWPYTNAKYLDEEYNRADILLAPSLLTKESFIKQGIPESKIACIGRGADISRFISGARPASPFRLVFFGRVGDRKGIFQAIKAWNKADLKDGEFWIIGDVEKEAMDEIKKYSIKNVILKGFSSVPEGLLKQCHVQILPTLFEGMAKSLVEGAACGLVTIATRESGFPITEGEVGYYCQRDDIDDMAAKIIFLAQNPNEWKRMSENSVNFIHKNMTWDIFRLNFIKAIQKLPFK